MGCAGCTICLLRNEHCWKPCFGRHARDVNASLGISIPSGSDIIICWWQCDYNCRHTILWSCCVLQHSWLRVSCPVSSGTMDLLEPLMNAQKTQLEPDPEYDLEAWPQGMLQVLWIGVARGWICIRKKADGGAFVDPPEPKQSVQKVLNGCWCLFHWSGLTLKIISSHWCISVHPGATSSSSLSEHSLSGLVCRYGLPMSHLYSFVLYAFEVKMVGNLDLLYIVDHGSRCAAHKFATIPVFQKTVFFRISLLLSYIENAWKCGLAAPSHCI